MDKEKLAYLWSDKRKSEIVPGHHILKTKEDKEYFSCYQHQVHNSDIGAHGISNP